MVPVALLIGRIAGLPAAPETSYGFLGQFKDYIYGLADSAGVGSLIPAWIQDVFRNPGILFLILFTAIAFTQQKASRRFALIVVAFLIPAMQSLAHDPRPSLTFGLGFLALVIGIGVQYSRYGDLVGQQNILNRLRLIGDRLELQCSLRISKRAADDGYITEDGVLAIIQREYSKHFELEPLAVRSIAQVVSHRLVREHRVLMRKLLLTGIVVIWLISPIDLFPDSIPILGALDDAAITLVGAGQWLDNIRRRRDPVPKLP
jgi:uncharacterized membrane protein YkvA (DUF1232 family)